MDTTEPPPEPETFASAFSAGLVQRHMSLTSLRDRLAARGYRISLATLSYWRSGRRVPARIESLEAVGEIEALLDLPTGSLAVLARDRRGQYARPAPFDGLVLGVAEGELTGEPDVVRVLFHLRAEIDRSAMRIDSTLTQLFIAARDGVTGVSMFIGPDVDAQGNSSRIEAVSGCRIESVQDRPDGIKSAWLEFQRPLAIGESALTTTRVVDEGPQMLEEREYGLVAEQKLEETLVEVRFAPGDVPQRCWLGYSEGPVEDEWEVRIDGLTAVHHRQTSFGPGIVRVRWEW